jgi:proteasome lid subunit RPN8/RPN11
LAVNPLLLKPPDARQIEEEGAQTYPNECCGILIGRDVSDGTCVRRVVERLVPMQNVFDAQQQRRRFAVDPLALMKAEKAAADDGLIVLGFYHSHPHHPPPPSEKEPQHPRPL